jgi:hypothetical protein
LGYADIMSGFAAKIIKETALVYDLRWSDENGTDFFAIFEAEKSRHAAFLEKMKSEATFNLKEFGKVLHLGFDEPDEALKAELREKYGMYQ